MYKRTSLAFLATRPVCVQDTTTACRVSADLTLFASTIPHQPKPASVSW